MRAGKGSKPFKRKLITEVGKLKHGTSQKFTLQCNGKSVAALLINYEGDLYAYLNRCRHIGISLDWVDN